MRSPVRLLLVSALLATGLNAHALTQYVSPDGDDDNPGTAESPIQTLDRALERSATKILMRHGNYFLPPTSTVIPAGVVVRGGLEPYYLDEDEETIWAADHRRTVLLKTEIQRTAGFILSPTEGGNMEGGVLENVTILGGFTSVEMRAGSRMTDVILGGGTSSTVLAQSGSTEIPSILDRVQITGGGGSGIQVAATGSMIIRDTLVRNTGGRGISITGTGNTLVENSVIQGSNSDGIAILGGNEVTILNNRILRNSESGILVRQMNPTIMGNLIERNDDGLRIINSSESVISQNTVVSNRTSGIFLNRSTPEISHNIIASNALFGVMEEKELEEPTVGGPLVGNLFWNNNPANYLDEGDDEWDTADELNTNIINTVPPEGNIVEDPLFTNAARYDYTLKPDSPAINKAPVPELLTIDLHGNPRSEDLGKDDETPTDLGAFEYHPLLRTRFATEYFLESVDPDFGASVKTSPNWRFLAASPFNPGGATFLPGRLRVWSEENDTFAAVARNPVDMTTPADKIAIVRSSLAMREGINGLTARFRFPGHEPPDLVPIYVLETGKDLAPSTDGREYELIFDLRQGRYRDISLDDMDEYPVEYVFDLLDFSGVPVRPEVDITSFEYELVDRDLFELQFNESVEHFDFSDGVEGWESVNLAPIFRAPIMRYSGIRSALEMVRPADTDPENSYFGAWVSPPIELVPGTRLRIEMRVSSNRPLEQRAGMRMRFATEEFSFSNEVVIASAFDGPALPSEEGSVYTMYTTIPEDLNETTARFYWDMWNFGEPTRQGSLFLEEFIITRTSD